MLLGALVGEMGSRIVQAAREDRVFELPSNVRDARRQPHRHHCLIRLRVFWLFVDLLLDNHRSWLVDGSYQFVLGRLRDLVEA